MTNEQNIWHQAHVEIPALMETDEGLTAHALNRIATALERIADAMETKENRNE